MKKAAHMLLTDQHMNDDTEEPYAPAQTDNGIWIPQCCALFSAERQIHTLLWKIIWTYFCKSVFGLWNGKYFNVKSKMHRE